MVNTVYYRTNKRILILLGIAVSIALGTIIGSVYFHQKAKSSRSHSENIAIFEDINETVAEHEQTGAGITLFAILAAGTALLVLSGTYLWRVEVNKTKSRHQIEDTHRWLMTAVNAIGNPLVIIDKDYRIVFANNAARNENSSAKYCYELSHHRNSPCDEDEYPCPHREVLQNGKKCRVTHVHYNPEGQPAYLDIYASPVFDHEGNIIQVVESITDITEQRKTELNLEESNRQLEAKIIQAKELTRKAEQANRAKSSFLARMSHDIRTPMNGVIGMLDLALDEELSNELYRQLFTARSSADSLLNIIDEILDISKIEAGMLDIEKIKCDTNLILVNLENVTRPRLKDKDVEFRIIFDTPIPAQINTDPTRLAQCLTNLLGNSTKFTEEGYIHLHVSLVDQDNLRFDVKDTGCGISGDKLGKIFEAFAQAEDSTTRRFGGTGLGLAITKQLSQLLGGSVSVQSKQDKGSTFTLIIPAGPLDKDQEMITEPDHTVMRSVSDKSVKHDLSGKILLAEDDPTNRSLVETILADTDLDITVAVNGREAVDMVEQENFDLILMDLQMPVLGGLEATQILRKKGYSLPIIALTANVMKSDFERTSKVGCDAHLGKPIDRKELFKVLKKYLDKVNEDEKLISQIDDAASQVDELARMCDEATIEMNAVADTAADTPHPVIDWASLIKTCRKEEMAVMVAEVFVNKSPEALELLKTAFESANTQDVILYSHRIRGSALNIGAISLAKIAEGMEKAGQDGDITNAEGMLAGLTSEFDTVISFLSQPDWMQTAKNQAGSLKS